MLAAFPGEAAEPAYFMWIEWKDDQIAFIHDYRYTRYVLDGASLELADVRSS